MPREVIDQISNITESVYSDPQNAIKSLEQLKEKYSPLPIIYNYLSSAYMSAGQPDVAKKYINENYAKNSDYFFAKTNYADLCLLEGKFKEIPKIFDYKFELKLLYPDRKTFHISEFVGFNSIICMYYHALKEYRTADRYYELLKQIAPKHPKTEELKRILYPSIFGFVIDTISRIFKRRI